MESNLDRFGALLSGFVRETQKASNGLMLELGTLNADGSLSVDSLSRSIPKGEYMVGLHLQSSIDDAPRDTHPFRRRTRPDERQRGAHT